MNHLYSHVVFLLSFIVESSSLSTSKENIHPRTIHGVHVILDFLRHHLQESFPVLGSFAVQFGDHLWYWDHLRGRTVLPPIFSQVSASPSPFKRSMPFLTVVAIIGNQAFQNGRCLICCSLGLDNVETGYNLLME